MRTKLNTFILLALITVPALSYAGARDICAIPPRQVQIEVDKIVPVKPAESVTSESVAMMLPTSMEPTSDSEAVGGEIMDHNLKNLMQGKYIRNNELLRSAQKVQEVMQPKVTFGNPEEGGVQHSVNLEYEAFQRVAKLKYEGYLKSDVIYESSTEDVNVSVFENLNPTTQVSVEHKSKEDLSYLKINWSW